MSLGPIRSVSQQPANGTWTVKYDDVTAYVKPGFTDYNFLGDPVLAEARARVWADLHGGTYWKRQDGGHYAKIPHL
ncbi:hypothetical protein [Kribbella sp. NPDC051770]|uniref:hypothetical protein n=1 Tax=Kribbella sp. NPDC051770 TaxID=3155413 RepID=UPI00344ACBC2